MYRTVNVNIWNDEWLHERSALGKLLFIYLFTNKRITACGAGEITRETMAFETGVELADIPGLLNELAGRVTFWPARGTVLIHNFYRHQRLNSSPKFEVAARKALNDFSAEVRAGALAIYPELAPKAAPPGKLPIDTLSDTLSDSHPQSDNRKQITESSKQREGESLQGSGPAQDAPSLAHAKLTHSDEEILALILSPALRSWAVQNAPGIDVQAAANDFVDYLREHNETRADYPAAFRRWLRREPSFARNGAAHERRNGSDAGDHSPHPGKAPELSDAEAQRILAERLGGTLSRLGGAPGKRPRPPGVP